MDFLILGKDGKTFFLSIENVFFQENNAGDMVPRLFYVIMEQGTFKNVNNHLNTNIYSYLETSDVLKF
jgi:hypothetical protein